VWKGRLEVALTRRARVRIVARARGRMILAIRRTLDAGRTSVRLPRRLPPGPAQLEARAVGARGAIATHTLRVLGRRQLPVDVARRALAAAWRSPGGDAEGDVADCAARSATAVDCTVRIWSSGPVDSWRTRVTLAANGWLWTTDRTGRGRIELLTADTRGRRSP
jgi:hypothetical protein